jgi:hypothetical protein
MNGDTSLQLQARKSPWWLIASIAMVAFVVLAIHFCSGVRSRANVRDEDLMKVPIDAILDQGWSMRTAIDFQEVKGPIFFWMYAGPGELTGDSINAMRFISIAYFVLGAVALLLIARRCGIEGARLAIVALLYILSPYNAFVSQLLMSEPSFNCLALWGFYAFIRGFHDSRAGALRWAGPLWFGALLLLMLHHRPHAVALAGAVVLTALARDGVRAWPWIAACAAAGLLRVPLYLHWGGLVTSHYQDLFGLGVRLDSFSYLLACVLPWTGAWIAAPFFSGRDDRVRTWMWIIAAGGAGALLGWFACPDLEAKVRYVLPVTGETRTPAEFAGVLTTALVKTTQAGMLRDWALAALAGLGAASLAGLALVTFRARSELHAREHPTLGSVMRLSFWSLACGLPLYIITVGPVYDRYLMVWTVLLPIAWLMSLPRVLLVLQATVHAGMLAWLVYQWLMLPGPRG